MTVIFQQNKYIADERLSDLTIIVLSYRRQAYLLRQMDFWNNTSVNLHILDGTEDKIADKNILNFRRGIYYHHLPVSVEERFTYAKDLIESPCATFLADDDFFIPSALCSCIERIEKDNLVACLGLSLVFYYNKDKVYAKQRFPIIRVFSSEEENPRERMIKMMSAGVPIPYAVHKRDAFLNFLSMYPDNVTSCTVTPEMQYRLLTAFQGKTRVIDELMWLSSSENPPVNAKGWNRKYDVASWYANPEMASEVESFFQAIMNVLMKLGDYDAKQLRMDLEEAVRHYISCKTTWKNHYHKEERLNAFFTSAARYVPDSMKSIIKPWVTASMDAFKFDTHKEFKPLGIIGSELVAEGTVVDLEQLANIEEKIRSFHAKQIKH